MESEGRAFQGWHGMHPRFMEGVPCSWQGDQRGNGGGRIEPQPLAGNICHDLTVMPEDT